MRGQIRDEAIESMVNATEGRASVKDAEAMLDGLLLWFHTGLIETMMIKKAGPDDKAYVELFGFLEALSAPFPN